MTAGRLFEFGDFRLDPAERLLFRSDKHVPLPPKAVDMLLLLVERRGHIVDKDTLLKELWPDTFVEEGNLAQNISVLRKILTEGRDGKEMIETIPKRGYRFIAEVHEVAASPATPALARSWRRHFVWAVPLGLAVVSVAGYFAWHHYSPRPPQASPRIMLAVLPVQNLTGDPAREYVSDGLTEEMIAQLGGMNPSRLGVIARTSSMAYKQTTKTVGQIGRELGVDYVLETSLRESPGEVRFTAQLIRTRDQTHVWAHSYERAMRDTLQMQGELANTVASEVRVDFSPERQARLAKSRRPIDPVAYDAFVQGRYHWNKRSPRDLHAAVGFFEKAIAKDPEYAPAYAALADSYSLLTSMREYRPAEAMPKAKDALLKALAIDDSLSEAHTSLGWVMEVFDWDWAGAEKEFRKALELDPNDATAHHRYAIHLAAMGNFPEALAEIREAQKLDPISPVITTSTGWIFLRSRLPDRALPECQKALDLDAKFVRGHLCFGEVYEAKHEMERAANKFLDAKSVGGEHPEQVARFRRIITESGYQGYCRAWLEQLDDKAKNEYVSPYEFADLYVRLGDKEKSLKWLERAYQDHSPYLVNLQIEPRFDFLRSDARFQDLVRRMGLADLHITLIPAGDSK